MIVAVSTVVHVDERGVEVSYGRGRAPRGGRVYDTRPGKRTGRTNVVEGLMDGKHVAAQPCEHSTTAAFFEDWFEFELLAAIPERSLAIMDNASFHRKKQLCAIAARHGSHVLFLPPYSPDLNPIEPSWANFKSWLCDNLAKFFDVSWAVRAYFDV